MEIWHPGLGDTRTFDNETVSTHSSWRMGPPPNRPTAVGVGDPFDDIFAAIDRLNGAELREFLSRIRERYTLDR